MEALFSEPLEPDEMTKVLEEYGELQNEFESMGGYEAKTAEILTGLGIGPEDYGRPVESFSGGWKMRIALAKILLINPDMLLMDEPTNHLDVESIIWLEAWLKEFKGAILMTCHDREFMNQVVSRIVEVAHKGIHLYGGDYDFYEQESAARLKNLISSAKSKKICWPKTESLLLSLLRERPMQPRCNLGLRTWKKLKSLKSRLKLKRFVLNGRKLRGVTKSW